MTNNNPANMTFEVPVAGVRYAFNDNGDLLHVFERSIRPGMKVLLQKEVNNSYDRFAVGARCAIDGCSYIHSIGHVSADYLGRVWSIMNDGDKLTGEVCGWDSLTDQEEEFPVAVVMVKLKATAYDMDIERERELTTQFTPCQHPLLVVPFRDEEQNFDALCETILATDVNDEAFAELMERYHDTLFSSLAMDNRLYFLRIEEHVAQSEFINTPAWGRITHKYHNSTALRAASEGYTRQMEYVSRQGLVASFEQMYPSEQDRQNVLQDIRRAMLKAFSDCCLTGREATFADRLRYSRFSRKDLYQIYVHKFLMDALSDGKPLPAEDTENGVAEPSEPSLTPLPCNRLFAELNTTQSSEWATQKLRMVYKGFVGDYFDCSEEAFLACFGLPEGSTPKPVTWLANVRILNYFIKKLYPRRVSCWNVAAALFLSTEGTPYNSLSNQTLQDADEKKAIDEEMKAIDEEMNKYLKEKVRSTSPK